MMDTLSDVLRAVRLTGAVFFAVDASAPWVAETPSGSSVGALVMPGVEHIISYHVIASGSCWAGLLDEPAIKLEAGDIIVFPQGDPHVVSSAPGMRGKTDMDAFRAVIGSPAPVSLSIRGGSPKHEQVVCGYLGCDARPFNPLLATLPRILHLRPQDETDPLHRLVELAVSESARPREAGGLCVLNKLSELLFVEVVRRYVAQLPPEGVGWFAGLRDENIGRALQKLHERPADDWSLEGLAKECGLSRSVLAERFAQLVGVPPIQYLAQWRIQLAATLLRDGKASLAEIAQRVGYGSEAALSRAFKRQVGVAPALYRRRDVA